MFIEKYFATYPKVREYMQKTIQFAYENGYVEQQYLPDTLNISFSMDKSTKKALNIVLSACITLPLCPIYEEKIEYICKTRNMTISR